MGKQFVFEDGTVIDLPDGAAPPADYDADPSGNVPAQAVNNTDFGSSGASGASGASIWNNSVQKRQFGPAGGGFWTTDEEGKQVYQIAPPTNQYQTELEYDAWQDAEQLVRQYRANLASDNNAKEANWLYADRIRVDEAAGFRQSAQAAAALLQQGTFLRANLSQDRTEIYMKSATLNAQLRQQAASGNASRELQAALANVESMLGMAAADEAFQQFNAVEARAIAQQRVEFLREPGDIGAAFGVLSRGGRNAVGNLIGEGGDVITDLSLTGLAENILNERLLAERQRPSDRALELGAGPITAQRVEAEQVAAPQFDALPPAVQPQTVGATVGARNGASDNGGPDGRGELPTPVVSGYSMVDNPEDFSGLSSSSGSGKASERAIELAANLRKVSDADKRNATLLEAAEARREPERRASAEKERDARRASWRKAARTEQAAVYPVGGMAKGGLAPVGVPFIEGEAGPELNIPQRDGRLLVLPLNRSTAARMLRGGTPGAAVGGVFGGAATSGVGKRGARNTMTSRGLLDEARALQQQATAFGLARTGFRRLPAPVFFSAPGTTAFEQEVGAGLIATGSGFPRSVVRERIAALAPAAVGRGAQRTSRRTR